MSNSPRKLLRQSIQRLLIPKFVELGFELHPNFADATRDDKVRNPFGILKRHSPDGVQQIEVDLGEPPRDDFSIEFGLVPYAGITSWGFADPNLKIFTPAELMRAGWALKPAVLCSSKRRTVSSSVWRRWSWPWQKTTQIDQDNLVLKAVAIAHEVDEFFSKGVVGNHVRVYPLEKKNCGIGDLRNSKP